MRRATGLAEARSVVLSGSAMLGRSAPLGIALLAAIFVLALGSLGLAESPEPAPPAAEATAGLAPAGSAPAGAAHGAALYAQYCALCHGAAGEGYTADFAPSLVTNTFLATATDAFLTTAIVEGRPGTAMGAYGKSRRGPLGDADVAEIISFLRAQRPWVAAVALSPQPAHGDPGRGKILYANNCQRCHGDQKSRINAVHLANPVFLASASDEFLRYATLNGRPPTPMLAWGPILEPQAIEDILAYVRSWQSGPEGVVKPAPLATPATPPVVIHPEGEHPTFSLREDRFVRSADVAAALDKKQRMVIIDARTPADWERAHITGAISVPYYAPSRLDVVPKDGTWVLAYCACPHHASGEVIDELRRRGYAHTAVIDEGVIFWEQRGYPMTFANPAAARAATGGPTAAPPAGGAAR